MTNPVKLGLTQPVGSYQAMRMAFHEDGMEYELFYGENGEHYLAASHEDVGMVTWFEIDEDYWQGLVDEAAEVVSD